MRAGFMPDSRGKSTLCSRRRIRFRDTAFPTRLVIVKPASAVLRLASGRVARIM